MFQNLFKVAIRILLRNKIYSIINLLGLTIGIACSLLILIMVWEQLTYDRFHENAERIFLLQQKMNLGTGDFTTDGSGGACAQALKDGFPEIINTSRIINAGELLLSYYPSKRNNNDTNSINAKKFIEDQVIITDSSFFEVFSFPLIHGDPKSALQEPHSIVLTKEMADKYFGTDDPMNKTIRIDQKYDFRVTGVVDEYPENSTIKFDFLLPFSFLSDLGYYSVDEYEGNPFRTFLLLNNPESSNIINEKLNDFLSSRYDNEIKSVYRLLPFTKMNLFGENHSFYPVLILSILALLILFIACINFMNLSTARFLTRTREVGIRKVVGASRSKLVLQFIGETMIMAFIAINIAILVVDITLPSFNKILESKLVLNFKDPALFILLIFLLLITGLIAGSYPAFFLSSFKPSDVLKKAIIPGSRGGLLRKILVVIQFVFSIIFIISTVVIFKQFNYMQTTNLGVSRENIIYFPVRGELTSNYQYLKQELLDNPDILYVTTGSHIPLYVTRGEFTWGLNSEDNNDIARLLHVGYDFQEAFDIKLKEGRFYSTEFPGDSAGKIVVNEALINKLELDSPIGKTIYLMKEPYTIIGVTDNFITFPVKIGGEILLLPFRRVGDFIFIKTRQKRMPGTIKYIEETHNKFNPDYPFISFYMDDYLDPISNLMDRSTKIILAFTLFGIFISCLGLFGLSTFSAEQKTKEIAIRKAMGASIRRILLLVNTEFLKLVCIACVIAIPFSIFFVRFLLQNFSRRTELNPGIFIYTGILILAISILTTLYQAFRSATKNPADSLRYE
jgi:putative ABC transport system permease protein